MRAEDAAARRRFWMQTQSGDCEHPVAALEESEKGYLTGRYVCTTCGMMFERGDVAQPCSREQEFA